MASLMSVSAEEVAEMLKVRWVIESFFRWTRQNLNLPVLFGTTPNALFNQLYAALVAYVLLKWLFDQTRKRRVFRPMSFVSFQHQLLQGSLPVDWQSELADFLYDYQHNRIILYNYG
ncbi:transposase [Domibacillus sp. A3M-37]|uniref:transposase n=1 Tax=Domibacillus sp. A3M-37 TaxID=2962037 RepID=UPI0020B735A0|nr:transposase [Domibacillus sp. A3M-37]MCP3764368.1 transposase [Domibacillus sp. A3M-37]